MTTPTWIPVAAPVIGEREVEYVTDAVKSGWVSSIGPYLDRFERGFAEYCGSRHGIALSNGTVALHLALRTLGIGPGDEVLVPDLTFAATAHAVLEAGATPVFVDVDETTWCIDPEAAARAPDVPDARDNPGPPLRASGGHAEVAGAGSRP
ncbi:MAG: aminotransferase class I/II-fold pyridoxal phosphate-dependent enzyme [Myxococcales bacterium]|nr:aminotransferase class I/II-fold pyridoxal phosphate-dependent enzyme [Myxococcales bacterium]